MAIKLYRAHSWDLTPAEALHLQDSLRELVRVQPLPEEGISRVCAVDASYAQDRVRSAAVAVDYHTLALVDQAVVEQPLTFPYIPGLLSFREAPASPAIWGCCWICLPLEWLSRCWSVGWVN